MKELNTFEIINPVVNSAGYSLSGLARGGVPEAVKLRDKLLEYNSDITVSAENNIKTVAADINTEFRYKAVNRAIEKTGIRNVIDLGCGYSPRPLALAELGYNVLGADLPAVIEKIEPAVKSLVDSPEANINYLAVDATNAASVAEAADALGDEIVIVTEGLLSYLTESELWTVLENIRTTLLRHGGVWITPDFNEKDFTYAGFKTIAGPDVIAELEAEREKYITALFGEQFSSQNLTPVEMIGSDILFELHLKEDLLPFYDGRTEISSLSLVSEEIAEACKDVYSNCGISVISEDDSTPAIDRLAALFTTSDGTLSIRHEIINGILKISLKGRLDSLTSTDLLNFYEEELSKKSFRKVQLDFKELDYISSAGLRVLLIMYKGTPGNDVKLLNIGTEVFSVLEMTGYSEIFGL